MKHLGYAKIAGKWGIAVAKESGNDNWGPDDDGWESWLFNEAPRELRLEAIERIPELLNELSKAGTEMAAEVRAKLVEAQEVAGAIKVVANEEKGNRTSSKQGGGHKQ